jgi:hypothetical protein
MLFNIHFKAKQWLTVFLILLFSIQFVPINDYHIYCWQSDGQEQTNDEVIDGEQAISIDKTLLLQESYHLLAHLNNSLAITRENARLKIPENHAAEIHLPPPNSNKL